jgi:hypothetical protein
MEKVKEIVQLTNIFDASNILLLIMSAFSMKFRVQLCNQNAAQ